VFFFSQRFAVFSMNIHETNALQRFLITVYNTAENSTIAEHL